MNGKTFVDTNVLIYAHDVDAKAKHAVAKEALYELWAQSDGFSQHAGAAGILCQRDAKTF
jgi:predicted nucleic acid-binding protein